MESISITNIKFTIEIQNTIYEVTIHLQTKKKLLIR